MNAKLQNISNLFRNARTRTILVFTGIVLGIVVVVGIVRFTSTNTGVTSRAQVAGPGTIQSIPGGFNQPESPEYAKLQAQQNTSEAKSATKHGTSAIPTIINANELEQETPPAATTASGCGCCPGTNGAGGCPTSGCPGASTAPGGLPLALPSSLDPGTIVYDGNHRIIGTLGPDGKVRDSNAKAIGVVGPDSLVRDSTGTVIGGAAAVVAGSPVYDNDNKLLGDVGLDGKVRDAKGNVVGSVCPDGTVRNANGNAIGKAGPIPAGPPGTRPVYDSQGHLIGYAGADGKVRDANGNIIGTVGPDGTVRDANGNIIGKVAGGPVPGTPVYDANGKLIGTVGADGKVRDANGNIIGTVGPDGLVRDASGRVIGQVGKTLSGTPVYDAQGHLIGVMGPDGKVYDANGKLLGTVGLDGVLRDDQGNILGNTTPPGLTTTTGVTPNIGGLPGQPSTLTGINGAPAGASPELQMALARQAQVVSRQKADQLLQQMQAAMTGQASQLTAAWAPVTQSYVVGNAANGGAGGPGGIGGYGAGGASALTPSPPPVVKAGTVMFGVLITAVNSDEPGPILATIVEGQFKGGRLIGSLTNEGESVMLTFSTLTLPDVPRSISINAVAIDQNTARTGLSSYTNDHYLLRYGTLFASAFVQGYATALTTSGTTVESAGLSTVSSTPSLSAGGKFMVALGNVGQQYSARLGNVFSTPPTVHVYSGAAMGILFLADVPPLPTS